MNKRFFLLCLAVASGVIACFLMAQPAAGSNDTPAAESLFMGLKPGEGRSLVVANCIPCHSTAIIAANHMDRQHWDKIITTMQEKNGMWPLPQSIRRQILNYLELAQRVEDPGLDAAKESPWASPLYHPNPLW